MGALGSDAHRVLIEQIVDHYHGDVRVRAVAVFGSVSTGAWHNLSDVDVDVVIDDGVIIAPAVEAAALFGPRAVIILVRDAIGAWKSLSRGRRWDAVLAVQRMRQSLLALRGRRDGLRLDPADPAGALAQVIAEATRCFDVGLRRGRLLEQIGTATNL